MTPNYHFSSSSSEIDRAKVHQWLSEESYWAKGSSRATQDAAMNGSRNFGMYQTSSGRQVAYAGVVMDGVIDAFASLNLKRMLLATGDAHGLYAKFGFEPLEYPSMWMQRSARPVES